ncbi:MAG TPA: phosphotransferase [Marmoricola sp.]|jgi:Ser/Thr protein kinase RdoA (MazF antagonist)|nr:phosphotransferase [Marmoricola sp.]
MSAGPVGVDAVDPIPHGQTALRLAWKFLPRDVRAMVEQHLGAPVIEARSMNSGFTPGFASVLSGSNGNRLFVKAANTVAQRQFADAYREESHKLRALGGAIPAPRLLWVHDEEWVVLGFEAVDGHPPQRPWVCTELDRALDLAEDIAAATERVPGGLALQPLWEDVPRLVNGWGDVADDWPHRAEAAALAARCPELPDSDGFLHSDLRDDNILLCSDGRVLACDWNWPALGPAWLDLVILLVSAHGDGHDADALLGGRELSRDVDPEHVDAWLAALCGFMLSSRVQPVPRASPYLRRHAAWYAEAAWSWLAQRRGWS